MREDKLYSPTFVQGMFDEMAATYGWVNLISSFGFTRRWREQCIALVALRPGMEVGDWMSGMGETWHILLRSIQAKGTIVAVDLSPVMVSRARQQPVYQRHGNITVREEDILSNMLPDASMDCVISTFGLKTFSLGQQQRLANEVARVLRPGGQFSFLEISVPPARWLRAPYLFYLHHVIPWIGALFLGNPDNYRMLGIYTERFGNCAPFASMLAVAGLQVQTHRHFFGCATSVSGRKL